MSQLVQLAGKHTTQTAHRALSVIAYIAIIANIVKNVNIVYIRQLVNIAKIATIVNIVKSVNSVNSVLKIVGKSVYEPDTFFHGRTRKSVKNGNLYSSARYSETKKDIGMAHKRSNDGYA